MRNGIVQELHLTKSVLRHPCFLGGQVHALINHQYDVIFSEIISFQQGQSDSLDIEHLRPYSYWSQVIGGPPQLCIISALYSVLMATGWSVWRTVICLPEELNFARTELNYKDISPHLVPLLSEEPYNLNNIKPKWIKIPRGKFRMGSSSARDPNSMPDEKPEHVLNIPYTYWISKYPITVGQFTKFVIETLFNWNTTKIIIADFDHPVVSVNWTDCWAYCMWLTEKMYSSGTLRENYVVRLPTEAEWEKAARGTDGRIYPWGNEFDVVKCNTATISPSKQPVQRTTPVGMYSPQGDSPYGCADMAGNVYEWTNTIYSPYPYKFDDYREQINTVVKRVARGGSWTSSTLNVRTTYRARRVADGDYRSSALGFRIVVAPSINTLANFANRR